MENILLFHTFSNLFTNTGAKTKANLQQRRLYLERAVKLANDANDYYKLNILMKTLGCAANVFDLGECDSRDDENFEAYINSAVDILLHYARKEDDSGLHSTAEEELHKLLQLTIDESDIWGAHPIPFRIFKYYMEHDCEWNSDPFYHLDSLYEKIQSYKSEKVKLQTDLEIIRDLEHRLEQFVSLVAAREFLTDDFTLYRGAKREGKVCEIGIDKDEKTNLDLHQRQSLAERLIFKGTSSLHDIERGWPKTTYVVANLGFVVSDRPHVKGGSHKRLFKTISIKVPDYTISGRENSYNGHAEEGLYAFLLSDNTINALVAKFREKYGINNPGHKAYAVVLDIHGTYDMCMSCSKHGLDFQEKFREKLINALRAQKIIISAELPSHLPVIIRYSSDFKYHYGNTADDTKRGVLATLTNEGKKRELDAPPPGVHQTLYNYKRDIKYFGANLLVHGKENWHSFWNSAKREQYTDKQITLESWTAFATGRSNSSLTNDQKQKNYTQLGLVDTTQAVEQGVPNIGTLRIN